VAAVVGVLVGVLGRDDLHAGRQMRRVVDLVHLTLKALVDVDVRQRHADANQLPDDVGDDLVGGDAVRIAAAVDLDADHVRWLEEAPPGLCGRARAGQRAHATRHHVAHHLVVGGAGRRVDASVRSDRDHETRVRTGHSRRRRPTALGHDTQRRQLRSWLRIAQEGGRREQPDERSSVHTPASGPSSYLDSRGQLRHAYTSYVRTLQAGTMRAPRSLVSFFSLLLAVHVVLPPVASAQTGAASLTGIISDQTGAKVPGATVTATNQATNVAYTAVSNETGNYTI